MITHSVFFRLHHAAGSQAEMKFFIDSLPLAKLSTVKNFQRLQQTSKKNNFTHGFSMQFKDQQAYDAYSNDPTHTTYVKNVWIPQVAEFMEIDHVIA
jgi:hypothetical protein